MNVMVSLIEHPHGPSAALEPDPAVLIRRAAVSLHHSIDGDLRHGRQLHGRGSLLVGDRFRYDRTTAPDSSVHRARGEAYAVDRGDPARLSHRTRRSGPRAA